MIAELPRSVLAVTDRPEPSAALVEALRRYAARGEVELRLLVLNPAEAELHLFDPNRHPEAEAAVRVLRRCLPEVEERVGAPVIGFVSARHDPVDAIEAALADEPADELLLALPEHALARRLHLDLPRRLRHLGIGVRTVGELARSR